MKIEKLDYNSLDELRSNTYILYSEKEAIVIDPSDTGESVINFLKKRNLTLLAILLTHGHFDHIRGVNRLLKDFDVPIYVHNEDEQMLKDPYINCSFDENVVVDKSPVLVNDGDVLSFPFCEIKVIHTPFHTRGSVCYYLKDNNVLFSGDTLFKMSVGRDDLPNSCPNKRSESLKKIKSLPGVTKIYPGHGSNSTIEFELNFNAFLKNNNLV